VLDVKILNPKGQEEFDNDVLNFVTRLNIPFNKIADAHFREFFKKYIKFDLKSEFWFRMELLAKRYKADRKNIIDSFKHKPIYM
jgi:hypothetical protein